MAGSKRYYWLKLHEEFFNTPVIKYIRRMPDGDKITVIYLKLLLISLRSDGYIYLEGLFPTAEEELALVLDEDLMCVQLALAALEKVKLLERGSGICELYMTRFPEMIGIYSEGASAARMRAMRERNQLIAEKTQASLCDTAVTGGDTSVRGCDGETEIEAERKTDTDREQEKKQSQSQLSGPYGVSLNVFLSPAEMESLKQQFPDYLAKIDYFSSYMASTGRTYDNHYLTIVQWAKRDAARAPQPVKKSGFEDYSFKKGESY